MSIYRREQQREKYELFRHGDSLYGSASQQRVELTVVQLSRFTLHASCDIHRFMTIMDRNQTEFLN